MTAIVNIALTTDTLGVYSDPINSLCNSLWAFTLTPLTPRINDIVREKRGVTVDTALRLARFFNTTAQFWLNLQTAYDLKIAENTLSEKINLEVPQLQAA